MSKFQKYFYIKKTTTHWVKYYRPQQRFLCYLSPSNISRSAGDPLRWWSQEFFRLRRRDPANPYLENCDSYQIIVSTRLIAIFLFIFCFIICSISSISWPTSKPFEEMTIMIIIIMVTTFLRQIRRWKGVFFYSYVYI